MTVALPSVPNSQARASTLAAHAHDARDMLIGFQEQSNLGLGYLSAVLQRYGYKVDVFDFDQDPDTLLAHAKTNGPFVIGFSLIFQFTSSVSLS
jgi:B12 binding domain